MKRVYLAAACCIIMVGCKPSKQEMITKKWQATAVQSAELDKQIADSRVFFDTVGKSTDAETNEILYGARNMDSLRVLLKQQLDSFLTMQEVTVQNTWIHFLKDSLVVTSFNTEPDTVKWYFDEDGNLMLDEMEQKGAGSRIKMEVVKLEETSLQLRFNENGFSSLATFRPAGN